MDKVTFDDVSLARFIDIFGDRDLRARISHKLGRPVAWVDDHLEANLRQMAIALNLLSGIELRGKRILEVGAGQGFVSLYLRSRGLDATAIEPATSGFEHYQVMSNEVRTAVSPLQLPFHAIGAEELTPKIHGHFDVVFSVYVLEHLPQLERAFAAMRSVLRSGGVMAHICANYAFPYEPHFGVPLIPGVPKYTELLLPAKISESELWRSLNFITYGRVQKLCRAHGLVAEFATGLLYDQLVRLGADETFRARHGGRWSHGLYQLLKSTRLLMLTKRVPSRLISPMRFVATERGSSG